MKITSVHSLLRRTAALFLATVLTLPTAYATAGEEKLQTSAALVDGLTYRNTITVNHSNRVESFSLELEDDNSIHPILLQGSGTVYGAATINRAITHAQELGYHVLGAINTDFFSTASGVPIGIVIEDRIYKSSPGRESAMLITDGEVSLCETPQVDLTLTNQRNGSVTSPHHLNKWRSATGGMYLLNRHFSTVSTRTSTPGWYVRMKVVEGDPSLTDSEGNSLTELTVNSTLTLEVTEMLQSDQAISIGADEYILTTDEASGHLPVYESFRVGDLVSLTTSCRDEALSQAQWAGGVGDVMIQDGAITDSTGWTYINDGRAPRTALGVKADGTLLLYAVDGRSSGYSMGLSQMDLAKELLEQGCQWAVNLDGGGSTTISAWLPGQAGPAVRNQPSDGQPRSCATYLLLVTGESGDGQAHRLALKEAGLTVLTGSSLPLPKAVALDSGLNPLEAELADLTISSGEDLGAIKDGIYYAGDRPGADTLRLRSRGLGAEGTAQIQVVDSLTELVISREGSTAPLTALSVKPEESVQLSVTGSYWNRTALRDWAPVTWSVEGDIGSVDEKGLFTASDRGGSGSITASAGGLSQTIQVSMTNIHKDVTEAHWAYNAVEYCYLHGIVGGISATEFGRDQPIRRADFMLMLYNALGKPVPAGDCTFTDVAQTDYYYTALAWAQNAGLASGTGAGMYTPNAPITREQAFTILRQAMPLLNKDCPDASLSVLDQFQDKDLIADYAKGHTATLVAQGVVGGKGTGIDPRGDLTRAEMAVLLHKLLSYTPITDVPTDQEKPAQPANPETPSQPEAPAAPAQYTMTLNQTALTLASGESIALSATLTPAVEGAAITWSSSSPSSAAVSSNGVVTNLFSGTGSPVVTITASWGACSASCQITCTQANLTATVINAENGLNVRSGPGPGHAVIGGLTNNARVVVLREEEGWYQVLYLNKDRQAALGYVSGEYLTLTAHTP